VSPDTTYAERVARLYDWEHDPYQDDIEVFVALARRFGGPVLELACGTGRLLAPLAQAGLECTGVDIAPAMLARAHQRLTRLALSASLVEQDMTRLQLEGQRFRTILVVLDSFGLLVDQADQVATLRAAKQHATHDGRFILDVSNGNLRGGSEPVEEVLHQLSSGPITKWVVRRTHPAEQLDELICLYDETDDQGVVRRTMVDLELRWFTRFELELLLDKVGWEVEEVYGGYGLEPFGPTSERLIVIAR
jgi:ubiquinone/menaquinone biosynthesis C-methylase UbiE